VEKICNKMEIRAFYDVKLKLTKKAFGQKFVDYLGLTFFNSMPIYIKKIVFFNYRNLGKYNLSKIVLNWLIDFSRI